MRPKIIVVHVLTDEVSVVTHSAPHHADETMATAIARRLRLPVDDKQPMYVLRTRDSELIKKAKDTTSAAILDVGGEYDPGRLFFDHHQRGFAERYYEGGPKLATAGLLWRRYGEGICYCACDALDSEHELDCGRIAGRVYRNLIAHIDAVDNGEKQDPVGIMTVSGMLHRCNLYSDDPDQNFVKAVNLADEALELAINEAFEVERARTALLESIDLHEWNFLQPFTVLPGSFGGCFIDAVLELGEEAEAEKEKAKQSGDYTVLDSEVWQLKATVGTLRYCVFPREDGSTWAVQAIPPSKSRLMEQTWPLPGNWCGLRGEALEKATGVQGALFCPGSFFIAAASREAACKLAAKAFAKYGDT